MGRLTAAQWEQARADYEVRGVSLGDIARQYGVATSSVSRKARAEGWIQGRLQGVVEEKVAAVKEIARIETQTQDLPLRMRHTLQSVVEERLQAEGMLASLDVALAVKGIELAHAATSAQELETLARARRHLAPHQHGAAPATQSTSVIVNQQTQATAGAAATSEPPTPKADDVVRAALRGDLTGDDE